MKRILLFLWVLSFSPASATQRCFLALLQIENPQSLTKADLELVLDQLSQDRRFQCASGFCQRRVHLLAKAFTDLNIPVTKLFIRPVKNDRLVYRNAAGTEKYLYNYHVVLRVKASGQDYVLDYPFFNKPLLLSDWKNLIGISSLQVEEKAPQHYLRTDTQEEWRPEDLAQSQKDLSTKAIEFESVGLRMDQNLEKIYLKIPRFRNAWHYNPHFRDLWHKSRSRLDDSFQKNWQQELDRLENLQNRTAAWWRSLDKVSQELVAASQNSPFYLSWYENNAVAEHLRQSAESASEVKIPMTVKGAALELPSLTEKFSKEYKLSAEERRSLLLRANENAKISSTFAKLNEVDSLFYEFFDVLNQQDQATALFKGDLLRVSQEEALIRAWKMPIKESRYNYLRSFFSPLQIELLNLAGFL